VGELYGHYLGLAPPACDAATNRWLYRLCCVDEGALEETEEMEYARRAGGRSLDGFVDNVHCDTLAPWLDHDGHRSYNHDTSAE